MVDKHEIRWKLAHISNQLNKLIKEDTEIWKPAVYIELHNLRAQRDDLLEKLMTL